MNLLFVSAFFFPMSSIGEIPNGQKAGRYPRAELLVEAAQLAKPEIAKQFRILDARAKQKYTAGHIPGAVWVDPIVWRKTEVARQDGNLRAKRVGELGIDLDTRVVVYDDNVNKDAARIWWILRYCGIRDVCLLNGGWHAWQTSGGQVSTVDVKPPVRNPRLSTDVARLATKDQVLEVLSRKESQIVDARSREEYCGEQKTAKRNGSIPGAIHLEWLEVFDAKSQRFKSPEELAELFGQSGIVPDRPTITYCQSGGRAAVMAFTLELMVPSRCAITTRAGRNGATPTTRRS